MGKRSTRWLAAVALLAAGTGLAYIAAPDGEVWGQAARAVRTAETWIMETGIVETGDRALPEELLSDLSDPWPSGGLWEDDGAEDLLADDLWEAAAPSIDAGLSLETVRAVSVPDLDPGSSYSDAVRYVRWRGLMSGYKDGRSAPDASLTRGQAVEALRRVSPLVGGDSGRAGESSLEWAVAMDILPAGGDPQLGAPVTRAQFAALLYRFAGAVGSGTSYSGDLSAFWDADTVPRYAAAPLSWAVDRGVYAGIVSDALEPQFPVSRGQAALVLTAYLADATGEPVASWIAASATLPVYESASRAHHAQIQKAIEEIRERYGAVGIQAAVVERGRVTDAYASGWAVKGKIRMSTDHKIRSASLSKVAVAMAAMRELEEGLIDLEAPLGTYWGASFSDPRHPDAPPTIRQILSHTSSIASLSTGGMTAKEVLARLQSAAGYRDAVPGDIGSWEYSNYAFGVLGMTLERACGKTLDTYLDGWLFRPLNIDASFDGGDLDDPGLLASMYGKDGKVTRSAQLQRGQHGSAVAGARGGDFAGGLTCSARDLAKLAALLADDGTYEGLRFLSEGSVALMESRAGWTADGFVQCHPLRWRPDAYGRAGIFYHTGSAYGVYNGLSYDPDTGDGVVVLTTGASGERDQDGNYAVCGEIYDLLYRTIAR